MQFLKCHEGQIKILYPSLFLLKQLLLPDGIYLRLAHAFPPVRHHSVRTKAADGSVAIFSEKITVDHVVNFHLLVLVVPSLLHDSTNILFSSLRKISAIFF
jgi:hypothetical protein